MARRMGAFAICTSRSHLDAVVEKLLQAGHSSRRMLVILPQKSAAAEGLSKMRNGSADSYPQMEGMLAWLMKFGAIVITGLGLFVAGNTFSGVLLGGEGQDRGEGVLQGLGVPPLAVARYGNRIKQGGIFLFVDCEVTSRVPEVCAILYEAKAENISSTGISCEGEAVEEDQLVV